MSSLVFGSIAYIFYICKIKWMGHTLPFPGFFTWLYRKYEIIEVFKTWAFFILDLQVFAFAFYFSYWKDFKYPL